MQLNNELLKEEVSVPASPKRNSKQALIEKVVELSEKTGVTIESDSKLKRMNKDQLNRKLAELMETQIRKKMAQDVGIEDATGNENNRVLGIGALRMVHNIIVTGGEKIYNGVVARHTGYELENFSQKLQDPAYQQDIDACLVEISNENPEVLQYFESPYTRLMMIWFSCAVSSVKKTKGRTNVSKLGPFATIPPLRSGVGGRPENGKKLRNDPPIVGKTLSV